MLFMGVDLSTKTGVIVLNEEGNPVRTDWINFPSLKGLARAEAIALRVSDIQITYKPTVIVIENYSFGHSSSMSVNMEIGTAVRLKLFLAGTPSYLIAPLSLKKFVTGVGKGDKSVVRLGVYKKWGFEHAKDDIVDAYALARVAKAMTIDEKELTNYENEVLAKVRPLI